MKHIYASLILFTTSFLLQHPLHAQEKNEYTPQKSQLAKPSKEHLFRLFVDNDFINFYGHVTDEAYTSGARADYFYTRAQKPRWLPTAGENSMNIEGWSLMHVMFTPNNIFTSKLQVDDYPYSGALFGIYSLNSYNAEKKYSFQTELLAGVTGPAALGEDAQRIMHRIINYEKPEGWQHQLGNAPLLNLQFTAEQQLFSIGKYAEVIAGGSIATGTMINRASVYPLIRIGIMHPYFSGLISQYSSPRTMVHRKKWQAYVIAKSSATLTLVNALLEGGIGSSSEGKDIAARHPLRKTGINFEYGFVLSKGQVAFSMTQRHLTPMLDGLYSHQIGNMTAYFNW